MCINALFRHAPCLGTDTADPYNNSSPLCCVLTRTALSIASIAAGIFATTMFLMSGNVVSLGLSIVLGITAICLWPRRCEGNCGGGGDVVFSGIPDVVHHTFGHTLPLPTIANYAPAAPMPFYPPSPPMPPPFIPMGPPPMPMVHPSIGEQRISVGRRDTVIPQVSPVMPVVAHHIPVAHGGTGEERIRVGRHDRVSVHHSPTPPSMPVFPTIPTFGTSFHASGEERIPVGRPNANAVRPANMTPHPGSLSGEERIPVGRKHP